MKIYKASGDHHPANAHIPVRLTLTIVECGLLISLLEIVRELHAGREPSEELFRDTMSLASLIGTNRTRRSILLAMDRAECLEAATKLAPPNSEP